MRTGGKLLIDQLVVQGCRTLFTVPGESFLPALDALFDEGPIRTIVCRHEGGAAMMAEASGKLTGAPGVAFVTRAAGAANAVSGVYVAHHDSTPMLLLVGLTAQAREGRGAFQEIDVTALFGSIAKWVGVVRAPERIPEFVARAYQTALAGRPGPVVLGVPEDVLIAAADTEDGARARPASPAPSAAEMTRLKNKLVAAERPLVLVGGPGWSVEAAEHLAAFAETFDMPVATAFRRQDHFDNRHPSYVGHAGIDTEPKLAAAIRGADLLLIIGETPGDVTTGGYTLLSVPTSAQFLAHAHPSGDELGRLFRTDLPIVAAAEPFAKALARMKPPPRRRWARLRRDLRAGYERWLKPLPTPGSVRLEEVIATLSHELPEDAIVASGAGNYAGFLHRYFQYKSFPSQLAPTSGSMGYGLPAAIAAKIAHPERTVVALAGDGCLLMSAQELATAVQYGLPIILIVANNGMYGTIRMHQERHFPGRVLATSLVNPDFAALARSFGAAGVTVTRTEDFPSVLRRALSAALPTVIELKLDPEAISPHQTLSEIRGTRKR
ncbi:MAG TPA: thiamine pyrophosphate-binding protein [Hyphomicrobium sp.]